MTEGDTLFKRAQGHELQIVPAGNAELDRKLFQIMGLFGLDNPEESVFETRMILVHNGSDSIFFHPHRAIHRLARSRQPGYLASDSTPSGHSRRRRGPVALRPWLWPDLLVLVVHGKSNTACPPRRVGRGEFYPWEGA